MYIVYLSLCIHMYVCSTYKSAPLRITAAANVKSSLRFDFSLRKGEMLWGNPCMALESFLSWGGCGFSLLTASAMPVIGARTGEPEG